MRKLSVREVVLLCVALVLGLGIAGQRAATHLAHRGAVADQQLATRSRLLAAYRDVVERRDEIMASADSEPAAPVASALSDASAVGLVAELAGRITLDSVVPVRAARAVRDVDAAPGTDLVGQLDIECRAGINELKEFLHRLEADESSFTIARCRIASARKGQVSCRLSLTYSRT